MAERAPLPVDVLGRPYAAWWRRVVALVIDSLVVGVPARILTVVLIGIPVQGTTETAAAYQARLVGRALPFTIIVGLLYYGLLNGGLRGQTIGKRAMGIQVRDAATGEPIGVGRGMV